MFIFVPVSSEQKTAARGPRPVEFVTCCSETKIGSICSGHCNFVDGTILDDRSKTSESHYRFATYILKF